MRRYRVAQWGTGHTGKRTLQRVIDHPFLDLVAVRVYADEKVGRDAGDLAGVAKTGVKATNRIEDIIAAKPDCVLYVPTIVGHSVDDVCRLLEAGINIVTVIPEFQPVGMTPENRARVEAAAQRGKASIYGSGPSPGFSTDHLPLTFLALQRRLDFLLIEEFADMATRNSPELISQMFGMPTDKMDVSDVAAMLKHHMGAYTKRTAQAIGIEFDEMTSIGQVAAAKHDVKIGVTTIPAGGVAAWRFDIDGHRKGKPIITFRCTWYVTKDLDADWDVRDSGWHIVVEGDAPIEVDALFTRENYGEISPSYNANICVNAIANVVEAAPGIRTTTELPLLVPYLGG